MGLRLTLNCGTPERTREELRISTYMGTISYTHAPVAKYKLKGRLSRAAEVHSCHSNMHVIAAPSGLC